MLGRSRLKRKPANPLYPLGTWRKKPSRPENSVWVLFPPGTLLLSTHNSQTSTVLRGHPSGRPWPFCFLCICSCWSWPRLGLHFRLSLASELDVDDTWRPVFRSTFLRLEGARGHPKSSTEPPSKFTWIWYRRWSPKLPPNL